MPTLEHNGLVEMFRENPGLAPHFLDILFHVDVPPFASAEVGESSLDQLIPVEFRADLVIDLRDAEGSIVLAIVLEAQRAIDLDKEYSWPVYVSVVRAKKRCQAIVLTLAPKPEVAAWASRPIDLGLGLGNLRPLVIGPASVPVVTDPAVAEREKELAVLSALAHGNGPHGLDVVMAALRGLDLLDAEHATAYFQIVYNALGEPIRRALEAFFMSQLTETAATFPPFAQKLIDRGIVEGIVEGVAKGKRETLLRLLARAGIAFSEDDRARVLACSAPETLDRWIDNVLTAKTIADVLS